jgi:hypothetical protein
LVGFDDAGVAQRVIGCRLGKAARDRCRLRLGQLFERVAGVGEHRLPPAAHDHAIDRPIRLHAD